jgi:hypothetical protein
MRFAFQVGTKLQRRYPILIPVFSSCILTSVVSLIQLAFVVTSQGQVVSTITLVIKVGSKALLRSHISVTDVILAVCYISRCMQPPDNSPAILSGAKK